jgi:two-component system, chemotaxis family, chemotaxis protein CheY
MARITVVNDTPDFLELVHEILEGDRYETILIDGDRPDAFELIRASSPDLLMIDLRMGSEGLSGWDLVQKVREDRAFDGLPVLVCSADLRGMEAIKADMAASHHVATLAKPFAIDELIEAIDGLLADVAHGNGPRR